jgi:hypothetical protein
VHVGLLGWAAHLHIGDGRLTLTETPKACTRLIIDFFSTTAASIALGCGIAAVGSGAPLPSRSLGMWFQSWSYEVSNDWLRW